ncbi:MAG: hypothetical protein JWP25_8778 [Bradyrhizobium sp.]|nr:hypothetical protein [Bradyrhizobium sp.]
MSVFTSDLHSITEVQRTSQNFAFVPKTRNQPKAKPLDARAVRFSELRRGYALSLGSALAISLAYLANDSVTSRSTDVAR